MHLYQRWHLVPHTTTYDYVVVDGSGALPPIPLHIVWQRHVYKKEHRQNATQHDAGQPRIALIRRRVGGDQIECVGAVDERRERESPHADEHVGRREVLLEPRLAWWRVVCGVVWRGVPCRAVPCRGVGWHGAV